jgi:hypothetical protein
MNPEQVKTEQSIPVKASKQKLQLIGLGVVAVGGFLMAMNWHSALTDNTYWPKASFLAPMTLCWGTGLLLTRNQELPDGTTEAVPTNQAVSIVLGFLLGIVNWLFISGTLSF